MPARILYFALISIVVLEVGPELTPRTSYAVLYFGAILAGGSLFCSERILPHRILLSTGKLIYWYLARVYKLLTDPHWVTVQRAGFVVRIKKQFQEVVRGTKPLEDFLTAEGAALIERTGVLAETIYQQTRKLRKQRDKGYFAKVSVAIKVYRLSMQMSPVAEVTREMFMSSSFVRGQMSPFGMMGPIGIMPGPSFIIGEPGAADQTNGSSGEA